MLMLCPFASHSKIQLSRQHKSWPFSGNGQCPSVTVTLVTVDHVTTIGPEGSPTIDWHARMS